MKTSDEECEIEAQCDNTCDYDIEPCAQPLDDDNDGVYETVLAMELREEHEKLSTHKAMLRVLLQRQQRTLEHIQQRRSFQADCEDRIVYLRALEMEETSLVPRVSGFPVAGSP